MKLKNRKHFKYLCNLITFSMCRSVTRTREKSLGDIIYQIRFPIMDSDDFVNDVLVSKVLLPEESVDIMLTKNELTPHQQMHAFLTNRRRPTAWIIDIFGQATRKNV